MTTEMVLYLLVGLGVSSSNYSAGIRQGANKWIMAFQFFAVIVSWPMTLGFLIAEACVSTIEAYNRKGKA